MDAFRPNPDFSFDDHYTSSDFETSESHEGDAGDTPAKRKKHLMYARGMYCMRYGDEFGLAYVLSHPVMEPADQIRMMLQFHCKRASWSEGRADGDGDSDGDSDGAGDTERDAGDRAAFPCGATSIEAVKNTIRSVTELLPHVTAEMLFEEVAHFLGVEVAVEYVLRCGRNAHSAMKLLPTVPLRELAAVLEAAGYPKTEILQAASSLPEQYTARDIDGAGIRTSCLLEFQRHHLVPETAPPPLDKARKGKAPLRPDSPGRAPVHGTTRVRPHGDPGPSTRP